MKTLHEVPMFRRDYLCLTLLYHIKDYVSNTKNCPHLSLSQLQRFSKLSLRTVK